MVLSSELKRLPVSFGVDTLEGRVNLACWAFPRSRIYNCVHVIFRLCSRMTLTVIRQQNALIGARHTLTVLGGITGNAVGQCGRRVKSQYLGSDRDYLKIS